MERLAQPNESMFERNVERLALRRLEVRVTFDGQERPLTGFISGLDQGFVQICLASDQTFVLIDLSLIRTLAETGRSLHDIPQGRVRTRLHERTKHISDRAHRIDRANTT